MQVVVLIYNTRSRTRQDQHDPTRTVLLSAHSADRMLQAPKLWYGFGRYLGARNRVNTRARGRT